MGKQELDNLVRIQKLKTEAASRKEFTGMLDSARTRLADAQNESLNPDSQFDLAYGAAHRLALAALRHQDIVPKIELRCSRRSFTPSVRRRPTYEFS